METPPPSYSAPPPPPPPLPLSPSDERTYAMLAHFSVFLNLVSGFAGVIVPLILYLVYKDRSRYVAYQSFQAFIFQLVWWVGGWAIIIGAWIITSFLMIIFIGILCLPFNLFSLLIPIVPLVYGLIGGLQCNKGEDFRYWLIGDWVKGMLPQE